MPDHRFGRLTFGAQRGSAKSPFGVMRDQAAAFEAVAGEAIAASDGVELAAFIVAARHGTLLSIKVERGPEPLQRFCRMLRRLLDG